MQNRQPQPTVVEELLMLRVVMLLLRSRCPQTNTNIHLSTYIGIINSPTITRHLYSSYTEQMFVRFAAAGEKQFLPKR